MSDKHVNTVSIALEHDYQFTVRFDRFPAAAPLLVDEPPPLGSSEGPNPSSLLAAAVGNCLVASLAFCLRKARVEVKDLRAVAKAQVTRNDAGRLRVTGIQVELEPEVGEGEPGRYQRCLELFQDFCTVSASVKQGIPIEVTVKPPSQGQGG